MDAAQALEDLIAVSSQLEGAVLADAAGAVLASSFADGQRERVAAEALSLLRAAEGSRAAGERAELTQMVCDLGDGAVFVVRSGERFAAGVTGPDPSVGLVLYDLKTCLRLADEAPPPALRKPRPRSGSGRAKSSASGRRNTRRKKDDGA